MRDEQHGHLPLPLQSGDQIQHVARSAGPSEANGSSSSSTGRSRTSARASATLCRSPPDNAARQPRFLAGEAGAREREPHGVAVGRREP